MAARSKAVSLNYRHRLGQPPRDRSRIVGVTAERDHRAALLAPPTNDLAVVAETPRRPSGVDLQAPTAVSKRPQRMPELIFERVRIERPRLGRPVADGVVDVGEHSERIPAANQTAYLGQILPNDLRRWPLPVQIRHFREPLADRQTVQGTQHPVKLSGVEQPCGDTAVPMGFAQLHPSDDAKVRELVAAPLYAFQIRVQVQFRWSEQLSGVANALRCRCSSRSLARTIHVVKSACSVNATAGMPNSTARAQVRSIEPFGASQDHSLWT